MNNPTTVTGAKLRLNSYLNNNHILGFAIKNYRERFLIPSDQNIFGGIVIPFVLIDSGSNSSLFPSPTTGTIFNVEQLIQKFPFNQYHWTIGTACGVRLIPDTTLHIVPIPDDNSRITNIKCILHNDIKPLEFELPYIRFSLNKDDIKILLEANTIPFSATDKETLSNKCKFLDDLENSFSSIANPKKRHYCLLGQQFLRNYCSIQLNDTMIFLDKTTLRQKLFPPQKLSINEIVNYLYYERPEFAKTEKFLNAEDDEHGGHDLLNVSNRQIDIVE